MQDTDTQTAASDAAAAHNSAEGSQEPELPATPTLSVVPSERPIDVRDLLAPLKRKADKLRKKEKYQGELTAALFAELEPLLDEPTPEDAIEWPSDASGYTNVKLLYQIRFMDVLFGRRHWRSLTHPDDGGLTILAHIVIGNNLGGLELDATTGALIRDELAELHGCWEGWGGVNQMESKGNTLKGSATSALRRLLSLIGPGGDVFMMPVDYSQRNSNSNSGNGGAPRPARTRPRPEQAAVAGAGVRKASLMMVKEITGLARERKLPDSQLANLIRRAIGLPDEPYTETLAREVLAEKLNERRIVLPFDVALTLRLLVEQAEPVAPVIGTRDAARRPAAPGGGGEQHASPAEDTLLDVDGAQAA
jgi:hypothetical protein